MSLVESRDLDELSQRRALKKEPAKHVKNEGSQKSTLGMLYTSASRSYAYSHCCCCRLLLDGTCRTTPIVIHETQGPTVPVRLGDCQALPLTEHRKG